MTINAIAHGANVTFGYISAGITSLSITIISLSALQLIAIALSVCALIAVGIYFYQRATYNDDGISSNLVHSRHSRCTLPPPNDPPEPPPTEEEHMRWLQEKYRQEQFDRIACKRTCNPETCCFENSPPPKEPPSPQPKTS